jgi:UDP-glucose 4-epimerase
MRALVTGGAGFVGSHVAEALNRAGHQVLVIDNLATGSLDNLVPGIGFAAVDITDLEKLRPAFESFGPEVVLHQAAQTLVQTSSSNPIRDAQINVLGTLNVLEVAAAVHTRKIVFASSGGTVYGNPTRQPVPETEPLRPISPYGASKVAGEHYVQIMCQRAGMSYTLLRYGNIYGPRDIPASQHVITAFLYALLEGRRPVIEWDGEQSKDYVYVSDVAAANLLALDRGDGEAFNIGSGSEISVNKIFEAVCLLMRRDKDHDRGQMRTGDVRRFILDCRRAERILGWRATTPFMDGLRATVEHYRKGARKLEPAAP